MSQQDPAAPVALAKEAPDAQPYGLRRTWLAMFGAWLFPGLGHFILGRLRRSVIFGVLILGSFGLGLAHDGRLALHDGNQPILSSLQIVANVGVGPLDAIARMAVYDRVSYKIPDTSRYPNHRTTTVFRERSRSALSNYGTAYLWTAGLMNLLLIFDVWDIGRGRKA